MLFNLIVKEHQRARKESARPQHKGFLYYTSVRMSGQQVAAIFSTTVWAFLEDPLRRHGGKVRRAFLCRSVCQTGL